MTGDILTREETETVWVKASELRSQVRQLLGLSEEHMGNAQCVGHMLKRLQLTDRRRRKAYTGGQMYLIQHEQVMEMMERHDIEAIAITND